MITLVIVNVQNDFITGTMSFKGARNILEPIKKFIKNHRKNIEKIIFVCDWHPYTHCSFKRYGGELPVHCVQYTPGACIEPKLLKFVQLLEFDYEVCLVGEIEEVEESGAFSDVEVVKDELGTRIYLDCLSSTSYPTEFIFCGMWEGIKDSITNLYDEGYIESSIYLPGTISEDGIQVVNQFIKENKIEKIIK